MNRAYITGMGSLARRRGIARRTLASGVALALATTAAGLVTLPVQAEPQAIDARQFDAQSLSAPAVHSEPQASGAPASDAPASLLAAPQAIDAPACDFDPLTTGAWTYGNGAPIPSTYTTTAFYQVNGGFRTFDESPTGGANDIAQQSLTGVTPGSTVTTNFFWNEGLPSPADGLRVTMSYGGVEYARFASPYSGADTPVFGLNGATVNGSSSVNVRRDVSTPITITLPDNVPADGLLRFTATENTNNVNSRARDDMMFSNVSMNAGGICLSKEAGASAAGTYNFTATNTIPLSAAITVAEGAAASFDADPNESGIQPLALPAAGQPVTITEATRPGIRVTDVYCRDLKTNTSLNVATTNPLTLSGAQLPAGAQVACEFHNSRSPQSVSLSKTVSHVDANGDGVVNAGDRVRYTYTASNTGTDALTNVGVTETAAQFTGTGPTPTPSYSSGGSDVDGDGATDDLAPNASSTWNATYTLTQADINEEQVKNQARVNGTDIFGGSVTSVSDDPATAVAGDPTTFAFGTLSRLRIVKSGEQLDTDGDGIAEAGEQIQYAFTVTNTGTTSLTGVRVTDPLITVNGGPISLEPGASNSSAFTGTYTLTRADVQAGQVTNQATASATTPSGGSVTDQSSTTANPTGNDPTVTPITSRPQIELDKRGTANDTDGDGRLEAGETITYNFTVRNTGNATVSGIGVTDPKVTVNGGPITLEPGDSNTQAFSGTYTVTQADVDAGRVTNTATATGTAPNGNSVTDTSNDPTTTPPNDPTVVQVPAQSGLAVDKSSTFNDTDGDGLAEPGETITYTFTVRNTGNTTVSGVRVTDPKVTVTGGPVSIAPGASNSSTFTGTYTLTQADVDAGRVQNQASASGSDPSGASVTDQASNDPATDASNDPTVTPLPQNSALEVDKTGTFNDGDGDGAADVGETVTYAFTVTNTGSTTLSDIRVVDPLVNVSGGPITLAPGVSDSTTFTATYTITQTDITAGHADNQARATASGPDGDPVSDPDSNDPTTDAPNDETVVPLPQAPALELDKTGTFNDENENGLADAGETIGYVFTVTNTGNVPVDVTGVTDNVAEVSDGSVRLAPGQSNNTTYTGTYTITQADIDAGAVTNQASVEGTDPGGNPVSDANSNDPTTDAPNDPTVTPLPATSSLTLDKAASLNDENGNGRVDAGETISYAFTVTNTGTQTLSGVSVTDPLVDVSGGPITLAPGVVDSETFTATYTVTQADVNAGQVTNSATVDGTDPGGASVSDDSNDPTTTEPDDPTVTELAGDPSITLDKAATLNDENGNGRVNAGETISYVFTVTNTGNLPVDGIAVTDPNVAVTGGPISLEPGAVDSTSFTATYTLSQADIRTGQVQNQATATGTDSSGAPVSDVSNDPTTNAPNDPTITRLAQDPQLAVDKAGTLNDENGNGRADAGETVSYAFTVTNTGNVAVDGIRITDPLVEVTGGPISLEPGVADATTFTATYALTQADVNSGQVTNQATAAGTGSAGEPVSDLSNDPATAAPNDPTVVSYSAQPQLELDKDASLNDENGNGRADAGETIDYAFTITNTGNTTLTGVTVTDPKVNVTGAPIRLAPGVQDQAAFSATYTITQADINAGQVANTATVTGTDPAGSSVSDDSNDPSTAEPNDPTVVALAQEPSLTLDKEGLFDDANDNGAAEVGETITYNFTVRNSGNVAVSNITVSDPLLQVSGGPISLAPGARDFTTFTATYALTQSDIDAGEVTNQASAVGTDPAGSSVSDDSNDPTTVTPDDPTVTPLGQDPSLDLNKLGTLNDENGNGRVDAGETIDYAFTVTNTGNVTVSDITISDPKVTVTGGPITLNPGDSDATTFTATYAVTQADINAGDVTNQATATGTEPGFGPVSTDSGDPSTPATNDPTVTELEHAPALALTKTDTLNDENGNGRADAGETIDYAFTVTNTGNVPVSGITVSDPHVAVPGGPITLAPGVSDSTTFTATYTLTQGDINNGQVENQATTAGTDPAGEPVRDRSDDPDTPEDHDPTVTPLAQDSALVVDKAATFNDADGNGRVDAGETIDYAFTVTNPGNVPVSGITITDPLVTVEGGPLTLAAGATDSTSFTATYTVTQADINAGQVANQAAATGTDPSGDPVNDDSNDPATPEPNDPTVTPITQDPSITVTKESTLNDANDNGRADAGETIDYAFVVTNTGNQPVTGVTVSDPKVTVTGGPIALAPGASDANSFTATYTLTQADVNAGEVSNQAAAAGSDPDGAPVTDDASDDPTTDAPNDPTVTPLGQDPSISLTKTDTLNDENGNGRVDAGETIAYAFTVANDGNLPVSGITVTDPNVTVTGGPISLAPGAEDSTTFTATYTVTQADINAGQVQNQATATGTDSSGSPVSDDSDDPDTPGVANDPTVTDLIHDPSLAIDKTGTFNDQNGNGRPDVGETIDYAFTVRNNGNIPVTAIAVTDPDAAVSGGPITLEPGAEDSTTFTATHTLTQADIDAGQVRNQATAEGIDNDGETVTDSSNDPTTATPNDPTVTPLEQVASIALDKSGTLNDENGNGQADAGETVSYAFTVTNTGNVAVEGIHVTDPKVNTSPGDITLVPGASDSTTFTATYTLEQADIDAGEVRNQATAEGTDLQGEPVVDDSNDPATDAPNDPTVTPLASAPQLTLGKTSTLNDENGNGRVDVGETIDYAFTVTNTGNTTLDVITVTDPLVEVTGEPITLAPGESDSQAFTATYTITQGDINAGEVRNQATASGTDPSGTQAEDSSDDPATDAPNDPTVTPLAADPSIVVEKTSTLNDENGNGRADAGDTVDYAFTVRNDGNVPVSGITVSDPLVVVTGGPITLAPGAEDSTTFTAAYTVTQADVNAGQVENQATASGADPAGDPVTDVSDDPTTDAPNDPTVTPLAADPALAVDKAATLNDENGNGRVDAGETIDYAFTVRNTGNVTVSGITINDPLLEVTGGPITLAPGAEDSTTLAGTHTVTQADINDGEVRNQALAAGTDPSGESVSDESNDPSTPEPNDPTVTPLVQEASLQLSKIDTSNDTDGNGRIDAGETITYQFVVSNTGNVPVTTTVVDDPSVPVTGGPITLQPGDTDSTTFSATYTVTQADIDAGQVTNQATVSALDPSGDPVTDDSDDPSTDEPNDPTVSSIDAQPGISVIKRSRFVDENGNGRADAGDSIDYAFTVRNTGNVTVSGITVNDPLVDVAGGPITLAPETEDSQTFTATYVVTQADVDAGEVTNQATGSGTDPSGLPVSDDASDDPTTNTPDDPTLTDLGREPSIVVEKTSTLNDENGNGRVDVGETIDYAFSVRNDGNVTISGITVTDPLVEVTGGPITLAPGGEDTSTVTGTYAVTQDDIIAGQVINQATASGTAPAGGQVSDESDDPATDAPNDPTVTPLAADPSIAIEKTSTLNDENGNGRADAGDTIDYAFTVTNTGNVPVSDISVSDPLVDVTGGPITLAPGVSDTTTFTATYTLTQADVDAGQVENQATAAGSDPAGDPVTDDSDDPTTDAPNDPTVTELGRDPSIVIEKTSTLNDENGNGRADAGDTVSYAFTVTNDGNVSLSGITVTDPLVEVTGGPITLAPGASDATTFTATYTLTQADINAGQVSNQATTTGTAPAGGSVSDDSDDPTTDAPNDPTVTELGRDPSIAVEKTPTLNDENGNGRADAGESIDYAFTVRNDGNLPVSGITVTDPMVGVTGGPISLAPGAEDATTFAATYTLTPADVDAGQVENQATADGTDSSGDPVSDVSDDPTTDAPNDPTVTELGRDPSIVVEKTSTLNDENGNGRVDVGETVDYAFTVTNDGNVTVSGITVSDPLVEVAGGPITLAAGAEDSSTFTATYAVTQADINAGQVTNQATAAGTDPAGAPVSDDSDDPATDEPNDPTVTPLAADPSLAIEKSSTLNDENGNGRVDAGETIDYAFTVTNTGNVPVSDISVSDPMVDVTGGPITLAPGVSDSTSFTATYELTQADVNAGQVTNQATATGTDPAGTTVSDDSDDPATGEPNDPTVTPLAADPSIAVEKASTLNDENGNGRADAGETIDYAFTVTNTGNVTASGITVTDPLVEVAGGPITLAPGVSDSTTFTATYTVTQADINAGQVENQASATGTDPAGVPVTDDASDDSTTDAPNDPTVTQLGQDPSIVIEKASSLNDENGNGRADAGDTIDYAFTVTNPGNVPVSDITVNDPLVDVAGGPITLAPGASDATTFTATYTVTQADVDAGRVENQATATGTDPSGVPVTDGASDDPTTDAPNDPTVTPLAAAPSLAVEKASTLNDENGNGRVDAGDTIIYWFTVRNTGNVTVANITVSDPLVDVSGVPITLAPGASNDWMFTATYEVTQADINAGGVENQATAEGIDPSGDPVTDDASDDPATEAPNDPTVTPLAADPTLAVEKTSTLNDENGNGRADAGDTIDYAFTVRNDGNVPVADITVTDPKVTVTGGPITLAPGVSDSTTFTATYTLTQADVDAGQVENQATAAGSDPAGDPVTDDSDDPTTDAPNDPTVTELGRNPSIVIEKASTLNPGADGRADAGDTIDYTFTVINDGNVSLSGISVTDPLVEVTGGPISLAPGASDATTFTATYTLTQADVNAGQVENQATVTGTEPGGGTVSDDSDDPTTDEPNDPTVTPLPAEPSIVVEKASTLVDENGDGRADAGDTVSYAFTVTNTGNVTVSGIAVTDPLVEVTGGPIALAPGASDAQTFTATYALTQADVDAGQVTNQATATGSDPSGDPVTDGASDDPTTGEPNDPTVTPLAAEPSIVIEKASTLNAGGDGRADAGDTVSYAFTVRNTGNVTVSGITVSDPLVEVAGGPITLAPGESDTQTLRASYTLTQADVDAGQVTNQATATGTDPSGGAVTDDASDDPTTVAPNDPTVTVLGSDPRIVVEKASTLNDENGNGRVDAGDTIIYWFTVRNTGNVTVANITVSDPLVDVSGVPITLAPGASNDWMFTATYEVTQADINAGGVENQATAEGIDPSGGPVTDDASDDPATEAPNDPTVTPLAADPTLAVEKTSTLNDENGNGRADAGETIDYAFTVTNTGNVTVSGITISDPLVEVTGGPITLTPAASDATTFTATYTLTQADINDGQVANQATATGTDPAGDPVSDDSDDPTTDAPNDPTVTPLGQDPSIAVEKSSTLNDENGNGRADAGDTIDYAFTVRNDGNLPVTGITVTDPLVEVTGGPITLAPGETDATTFTATYTLTPADVDAGQVANQATADGTDSSGDPVTDISDDPTTDEPNDPTVTPLGQDPSIAIEKASTLNDENGNGRADAGETIDYAFTVTNDGNVTVSGITVTDPLVEVTGGPITLAAGESDSATFTATYTLTQADLNAGQVTNQATATGTDPAGDPLSDDSDDPTTGEPNDPTVTLLPADPSIVVEKASTLNDENGNGRVDAGETIDYAFTVTNTGNVTVSGITVTDPLVEVAGGPITLAPGAADAQTFTASYPVTQADIDAGQVENQATATGTDPSGSTVTDGASDDPTTDAPNDPTVTPLAATPSLAVEKSSTLNDENGNGRVDAGETIDYAFTVTNTGNVTVEDISVTDPLAEVTGGPISLVPGAEDSATFTATYAVTQDDIIAGQVTNQATATGTDPAGDTVSDASDDPTTDAPNDPTVTPLAAEPSIAVEKSSTLNDENGNGRVDAGETIDYAFTVTNTGNVPVADITVSDPLVDVTGGPITLAPGVSDSTTLTATYTLTQADVNAGQVTNQATAAGTDPAGDPVSDDSDDPTTGEPNDPTVTPLGQDPSIVLEKASTLNDENGNGRADAGETIDYAFTVTNTGNVTVADITVSDPLVEVTGGPITLAPGVSDSTTLTATYTLTQADVDAGQVTNQATATGTDPAGDPVSDDSNDPATDAPNDPTVTPLAADPSIVVEKASTLNDDNGNGRVDAGETIDYAFTVTNTGNVTVADITVSDPLVEATGGPITLAPGAEDSSTFTATHEVTQDDINAGQVTNQATATGSDPAGDPVSDDASDDPTTDEPNDPTVTPLAADPSIVLEKSSTLNDENGNGRADAGETIDYAFTVTNIGNVTVAGITVSDPLIDVTGGPITLAPGEADAQAFTANYTLTQADVDAGQVTNQATATGTDPSGGPVTDDASDDPTTDAPNDSTVTPLAADPSLAVEKASTLNDENGNGRVDAGETIDYAFTVTNTGNVTVSGITISDPLVEVTGGPITLAPAATDATTFTATYTLTQGDINDGQVANQATATGTDPAGDPVSDDSDDPTTDAPNDPTVTQLAADPSIAVEKSSTLNDENGNGRADVGETIDYAFTVRNDGNLPVTGITVTDPLVDVTGGPISLAPGETDATTFTATYALTRADIDAGQVENQATADGTDSSGDPVTDISDDPTTDEPNDPTVTELGRDPSIATEKTSTLNDENGNGRADAGETIDYAFTVTNDGNVTVSGITVSDPLVEVAGGPIALAEGESDSATFTATYTLTQADLNAGQVTNQATASGTDPAGDPLSDDSDDPTTGEPNDPTVTQLASAPSLAVEKASTLNVGGNGRVDAGDTIDYAFTVTNTGNVTVSGITVSDPLVEVTGGPITLAPGAADAQTFTATYTLTQADIDAGQVENQATATGTDPSGSTVTDDASDDPSTDAPNDPTVTPLAAEPSIVVEKTSALNMGDNGRVDAGDTITYAFTVTNTGNVTVEDITVTDPLVDVAGGPITLIPGESDARTFTATYTLTQADVERGQVSNQAAATGTDPSGGPVADDASDDPTTDAPNDPTVTELEPERSIVVEKTDTLTDGNGNGRADAGETIDYAFTVTNTGNVTVEDVTISDPLVDVAGGPITLAPGVSDTQTFTATYTLTQADINAGEVRNQATATGQDCTPAPAAARAACVDVTDASDDPTTDAPNDATVTALGQDPQLALEKNGTFRDQDGDGYADAGETIEYAFTVTNTGNVTVSDIVVTDPMVEVSGRPITLAPGESDSTTFTATYVLGMDDLEQGSVVNVASVTGTDPSGGPVSDDSDDPTTGVLNDATVTDLPPMEPTNPTEPTSPTTEPTSPTTDPTSPTTPTTEPTAGPADPDDPGIPTGAATGQGPNGWLIGGGIALVLLALLMALAVARTRRRA